MSSGLNFYEETPEGIKSVRIGTCFNDMTKKVMSRQAFITSKLGRDILDKNEGVGEFKFDASSNSSSSAKDKFFSVSAKFHENFLFGSVSASFNMDSNTASAQQHHGISANISYLFKGQTMFLRDLGPIELYNYMSKDFKDAYNAIMKAEDPSIKFEKYNEFIEAFGHGCVDRLYLTCGSMATISIDQNSTQNASDYNYAATVSGSWPGGGASAASKYGSSMKEAISNVKLKIDQVNIPYSTPTKDWVKEVVEKFENLGIDLLASEANFNSLPTNIREAATAPDIPEFTKKEGDDDEIPEAVTGASGFSDALKKSIMEGDNHGGDWDSYVENLENEFNDIDPKSVVKQEQKSKTNKSSSRGSSGSETETKMTDDDDGERSSYSEGLGTLGSFVPIKFSYKRWDELFPGLKTGALFCSNNSILIAKIYTFYYTRLQFSQYLEFLVNVGVEFHGNKHIVDDSKSFSKYCYAFLNNQIQKVFKKNENTDHLACNPNSEFLKLVDEFNNKLVEINEDTDERYISKETSVMYDTFFKHYGFLSKYAYGFMFYFSVYEKRNSIEADLSYYKDDPSFHPGAHHRYKVEPISESISEMTPYNIRQYPVINSVGQIRLVSYSRLMKYGKTNNNPFTNNRPEEILEGLKFREVISNASTHGPSIYKLNHSTVKDSDSSQFMEVDIFEKLVKRCIEDKDVKINFQTEGYSGMVFYQGENRENNYDMRIRGLGYAHMEKYNNPDVRGKAMWEKFPFDDIQALKPKMN